MLPLFPGEERSLRPSSPQMDIIYSAASSLNISLKFLRINYHTHEQSQKSKPWNAR